MSSKTAAKQQQTAGENVKRKRRGDADLAEQLGAILIGQPQAIATIAPYVSMFRAGLNPPGRPGRRVPADRPDRL
jgi:ATP-dependent Clp protease ATP-binding subunit ClpA